ncbi:MAG: DNA ligase, partial [Proteobacteria bacterium]|nr:DNA ligase [Pseudomonadota bacterium]
MKAKGWDGSDPAGYWISEKLDGVRALWNWDGNREFTSRGGNVFFVPDELKASMPDCALDGEFWIGRGKFQETVSIVRRKSETVEGWKPIRYMVFDVPMSGMSVEARQSNLATIKLPG